MVCGFSRNNHLLDSFLGRLFGGKIKVRIVNILLMLALFTVGKVTQFLAYVPLGHRYWSLFILLFPNPSILCVICL